MAKVILHDRRRCDDMGVVMPEEEETKIAKTDYIDWDALTAEKNKSAGMFRGRLVDAINAAYESK